MQLIATGRRQATDGTRQVLVTITIDPWPDSTQAQFLYHLGKSSVLTSGHLVALEPAAMGHEVTVVLTNFGRAKEALKTAGQLPRFCFLLPDQG